MKSYGHKVLKQPKSPSLNRLPEEVLIADTRAGVTPSQFVERKLISLLGKNSLPLSYSQSIIKPRGRAARVP